MKKFIVFLLVLFAIAAVAVVTCPDRQSHKEAIMSVFNQKINEIASQNTDDEDLALFGAALGSTVLEYAIDNRLTVNNHFVYSTGELLKSDGPERVSIGVFGHVFTFSKEDLDRAFEGIQ